MNRIKFVSLGNLYIGNLLNKVRNRKDEQITMKPKNI